MRAAALNPLGPSENARCARRDHPFTEVALRVDESDTLALVITGNTVPGAIVEVDLYYTSR